MASRKLVRDLLLSQRSPFVQLISPQASSTRFRLLSADRFSSLRRYSVFNEFSKKIKGEAERNPEFQQSVKELKERAEELKGAKEDLKVRTKQKTEQLYKQVDDVWTEAEAVAKKVSSNVKEKISSTAAEMKEALGVREQNSLGSTGSSAEKDADANQGTQKSSEGGKQDSSGSADFSAEQDADLKHGSQRSSKEEKREQFGSDNTTDSFFGKFKSNTSSPFHKLKATTLADIAKKGYDMVKEELSANPTRRRHVPTAWSGEKSTRTELVIVPSKQSQWNKKWEQFKEKVKDLPITKRFVKYSDPVKTKGQEIVEDLREKYETSDNPIIHKIQDINDSMFQESDAAISYKEIRQRDPEFSLPEFVAEVQEAIKPILNAYMKGDIEVLKKYTTPELVERCKAEHRAYQSHGIFFDNKILHVGEAYVREVKMVESSPIIIIEFLTQQVYCVRDRNGKITEGSQDNIHIVFYKWALQQMNLEDRGEDAIYLMWRLCEMQQQGVKALI
ncbi:hypothetical protein L6164_009985 [Bauhinia variegata]|uniref:Uncharacterized protein n=1 Tax=Bauhinia variegata TaxID=167791 RepID=A0ACB9PLF7_BAUVA|nr:hypothetical protein L6164_009985 [Bauhinia variegata]